MKYSIVFFKQDFSIKPWIYRHPGSFMLTANWLGLELTVWTEPIIFDRTILRK